MQNYGALVISGSFAVLAIGLGLPLAYRKVRRNCWYGYRLNRYVMTDDDIWYEVNALGGKHVVIGGCCILAIAIVSIFFIGDPGAQSKLIFLTMVLTTAGLAYSIYRTFRLSHRLAETKGLR